MRALCTLVLGLLLGACATPHGPPRAPGTADDDVPHAAREMVMHALALIGVPYRYGGTSPDTGLDCSGLVRHVAAVAAGLKLAGDARSLSGYGEPVDLGAVRPGDLVFFNTLRRPYSHVGIYLGGRRFIHAPSTGGVVEVVDMNRRYWQERYEGARRLPL
jgi:cell wall-associated NlpC family hydrolase